MRVTRPVQSYLTYTLGKDLYIPLTCRCNSRTLPETRGPNFMLPAPVVAALCRVRDLELSTQQWTFWCNYLDTQEGAQKLPERPESIAVKDENCDDNNPITMNMLQEEIDSYLRNDKLRPNSLVFAGEGEPTLRLDEMLELVGSLQQAHTSEALPPIRVTTNGLRPNIVSRLKDGGVSRVSIALMTADPTQYDQLMNPSQEKGHDKVRQFIQNSIEIGLEVEATAVDRDDVDKTATQELAKSLGVDAEDVQVRWRPYFG